MHIVESSVALCTLLGYMVLLALDIAFIIEEELSKVNSERCL